MSDIPVVFVLSVLLVVAFGLWEHYVAHHTTLPPIVHLAIFTRHHWKVTGVLLSSIYIYLDDRELHILVPSGVVHNAI